MIGDHIEPEREAALADALEDFHRRRARGEVARVDDYRPRLGDSHPEFTAIVEAETLIDEALAPPAVDPLPRPFGPYTLLRELGRGAAGVVYEAVHRDLGRTVALKVLRTGFDTDKNALERFRREARACAHVRHDHIVAIFEVGDVDGRPFYAMDLVPGETLAALVKAKRLPSPVSLCGGLAGIANALQALHDAGIVHRDVKPSNVMVRTEGKMLLADFGLARSAEAATLTRTGDALGTPLYMSPEQILGQRQEVDARTDVYGLGATFYEALTGRPVFEADEMAALMKMILTQRPVPLRAAVPSLPEACERIALKCLEKSKNDRYATAKALGEDLLAFAEGRPVAGHPVGPAVRALRIVRKQWIPIAAALLVVLGGSFWWTTRPAHLTVRESVPLDVAVYVDGQKVGTAPLIDHSVSPGVHTLRFVHDDFESREQKVSFSAGGSIDKEPVLWPKPGNEKAREAFKRRTGVEPPEDPKVPITRGERDPLPRVRLFFPRGDVRHSDLDAFAVQVDSETYLPPGRIEFLRGDEVLGEIKDFDPPNRNTWLAVPASVRDQAKVGDTITWGWYPAAEHKDPKNNPAVVATFRIVDVSLRADLDRLAGLEETRGDLLRIQVLRKRGLETAAFREAYALSKKDLDNRLSWGLVRSILEVWGDKKDKDNGLYPSWFRGDVDAWLVSGAPHAPDSEPGLEPPPGAMK